MNYLVTEEQLRNLYWTENLSLREIGEKLGWSAKKALMEMVKYSIPRRSLSKSQLGKRKIELDQDLLFDFYYHKKMVLREMGELLGCSQNTVRRRMNDLEIPVRTSSESAKIRGSQKGRNNPFYGRHHTHKTKKKLSEILKGKTPWNKGKFFSEESKEKMSLTRKVRFENGEEPWNKGIPCSTETKEKISEANKGKTSWWKKRGFNQNPHIKTFETKPEIKFEEICDRYELPFRFTGDGSFWVSGMNPDFIHLKEKVAVEIFGNYWHSPLLNQHQLSYKRTYKGRTEAFRKAGWKVIIFWESEMKSGQVDDIVLERLKNEGIL